MIDPKWFEQVCCMSAPDFGGAERSVLLTLLAIEEEVLPYLLIRGRAFPDWQQSRAALKSTFRGMVRPVQARPVNLMTGSSVQQRKNMRKALKAVIEASVGVGSDEAALHRQCAYQIIASYQVAENQRNASPTVYIEIE